MNRFLDTTLDFIQILESRDLGGPGSGHFGHAGRPGEIGGSAPGEGGDAPRHLPEDPGRYFKINAKTKMLPLSSLEPTRAREKGIANAAKFMAKAYDGEMEKRDPIMVRKVGDKWQVVDGNSTYAVAVESGWKEIPVQVESSGAEALAAVNRVRPDFQPDDLVPLQAGVTPEKLAAARALVEAKAKADVVLDALGGNSREQFEALRVAAAKADKELAAVLAKVGDTIQGETIAKPGPKSLQRSVEKVVGKNSGDARRVRDPVRASIAVDTVGEIDQVVESLHRTLIDSGGKFVSAENRFKNPAIGGYRDLQINVKLPSGVVGEVQIHLKSILEVKNGVGHVLYKDMRRITEKTKLTATDRVVLADLMRQSEAVYAKPWKQAGGK